MATKGGTMNRFQVSCFTLGFAVALGISATAMAYQWEFSGNFRVTKVSSPECDFVFQQETYQTKIFFVGPTHRTIVVHFRNDETPGFLHGISLVGLYGYSGDFKADKTFLSDGRKVRIVSEGIVDYNVIFAEVSVEVFADEAGTEKLCTAIAEYTGFPR